MLLLEIHASTHSRNTKIDGNKTSNRELDSILVHPHKQHKQQLWIKATAKKIEPLITAWSHLKEFKQHLKMGPI